MSASLELMAMRICLRLVRLQSTDCVHWFRRAHDELQPGQRAGLARTNTIRQNYSREGSLDYIVQNGGTITEAGTETGTPVYTIPTPPTAQHRAIVCKREEGIPPR